jgi:beta-galactosidase
LRRQVDARRSKLTERIREADEKGIVTDYACVSEQVISAFQVAAQHDRANVERVRSIFKTFNYYDKTDPTEADQLPFKELQACLEVADYALAELRQQLDGTVTLRDPPDISHGRMALDRAYYRLDGRIVFPSSLVWMPKEEEFMRTFGRLGEAYYQLGHLRENGSVDARTLTRALDSLAGQCERNAAPLVFFMGHAPAGWMWNQHPEILQGARHFTQYDIDSPLIRTWIEQLCAAMLPGLNKAGAGRPQIHLLANEPHFATQQGGWRAKNGLSQFSTQKYRQ